MSKCILRKLSKKKLTADHFSVRGCFSFVVFPSDEATYCNSDRSLEVNVKRIKLVLKRLLSYYIFTPLETSANCCDSHKKE